MKTRQPRRTQSQWAQIIEQQSQSGLTIRAFCDQNDIGFASFGKWKRRLANETPREMATPAFQPIAIEESVGGKSPDYDKTSVTLTLGSHITLSIQSAALSS